MPRKNHDAKRRPQHTKNSQAWYREQERLRILRFGLQVGRRRAA